MAILKIIFTKDFPDLHKKIGGAVKADARTAVQIAVAAGMSQSYLYGVMRGDESVRLPIETLRKLEEVLGVDFGAASSG